MQNLLRIRKIFISSQNNQPQIVINPLSAIDHTLHDFFVPKIFRETFEKTNDFSKKL